MNFPSNSLKAILGRDSGSQEPTGGAEFNPDFDGGEEYPGDFLTKNWTGEKPPRFFRRFYSPSF